jgi:hypothetical protein
MKTLTKYFLLVACFTFLSVASTSAQTQSAEPKDYLIVVSNSRDKAANEKVLADVKANFEDAGMYYDDTTKQYYVYVERYYARDGADYAVWWLKKEHKELPKVWAKAVPPGAK